MNAPEWLNEAPPADDEVSRLRVPPHSVEAEQSVLGGLLIDAQSWDVCADVLTAADFYRHEHRAIWDAIGALVMRCQPADVITVHEQLRAMGKDSPDVGLAYLNSLAQSVPSAANARRYAQIVRERSVLRRLIAASDEIATSAFNPQGRTMAEVLGEAERKVLEIAQTRGGATYATTAQLSVELTDRLNDLHDSGGGDVVGLPTGFRELDIMTAGLQKGELIILAARPSMGKTALALNIAEAVALSAGRLPVFVFSMEMGRAQLMLRLAGALGRINQQHLRTGRLDGQEWERYTDAIDKLGKADIAIDETPALTVGDMRSRARRMRRDLGGCGLVVVDYLQLMSGPSGNEENRATQLGEISRGLKALAKELDCPVIALSQLNRSVEARADKRPLMSDLRESGAIEQDADTIAFIYRDDYYNKDSKEPGVAELIVAKQRSGPVGTVKLHWAAPFTRFSDLAPDYEPPRRETAHRGGNGFKGFGDE